ncbi:hypothetical protein TNCV_4153081 [Trichonephila clavipes]|nr:hypothetical protein TNCV_4153081 [Trichonephila clavipes]
MRSMLKTYWTPNLKENMKLGGSNVELNAKSGNQKQHQELQKIIPSFVLKEEEIVIFELQAKKFEIEREEWVSPIYSASYHQILFNLFQENPKKNGKIATV